MDKDEEDEDKTAGEAADEDAERVERVMLGRASVRSNTHSFTFSCMETPKGNEIYSAAPCV